MTPRKQEGVSPKQNNEKENGDVKEINAQAPLYNKAVAQAYDTLILKIFSLIPEHDKQGKIAGQPLDKSATLNSKNLTLNSELNLKKQYDKNLLPVFYNSLVTLRQCFLDNLDLLNGWDKLSHGQQLNLALKVLWNCGEKIKKWKAWQFGIKNLDSSDGNYYIPLAVDENSKQVLSYLKEFFLALMELEDFPAKGKLKDYINKVHERIGMYNLSQTLPQFSDLKQAAKDFMRKAGNDSNKALSAVFPIMHKVIIPFSANSISGPELPMVNDFFNRVQNQFDSLLNELDEKILKNDITSQEISEYEFFENFLISISNALVNTYGMETEYLNFCQTFRLSVDKIKACEEKINQLKGALTTLNSVEHGQQLFSSQQEKAPIKLDVQTAKKSKYDDPCQYLDEVCNKLEELTKSISNKNSEMKEKINQTIKGIKADKERYITDQKDITNQKNLIENLNSFQNKVTNRLNSVISFGKAHAVFHPLHRFFTVLHQIFQNVVSVFSEEKRRVKTIAVMTVKERYETSRGLFAVKTEITKSFAFAKEVKKASKNVRQAMIKEELNNLDEQTRSLVRFYF